jgi:PTS system cellobiose-specific IIB component
MINIVLLCAAGMSTSLMVTKMQKAVAELGLDYVITAYPLNDAPKVIPAADIILLAPQVRYIHQDMLKKYPDKKFEQIEIVQYGTMNGKAVIEMVRRKLD